RAVQHRHLRAAHPPPRGGAPSLHRGHGQRRESRVRRLCPLRRSPRASPGALCPGRHRGRGGRGARAGPSPLPPPRRHPPRAGQRGEAMSSSVVLALATPGAPLTAALLSVVIPPLRPRGAPAAVLTILASLLATAAAVLLTLNDPAGQAIRATVPWLVLQGRGLGEVGVRLDAVSVPMLAVVC